MAGLFYGVCEWALHLHLVESSGTLVIGLGIPFLPLGRRKQPGR